MKSCPTCNNTFEEPLKFCPHDGEVLREAVEDIVGRVLDGKYKVESFIAQGGMGAVYRARHILLGDRVVIKTLRSEMRDNSELIRRFQREGRAARSFSHPNAVTVYDLSTDSDGLIYLVMEYVEGQTLNKELKRRGRYTPLEALTILAPVADVLNAAHASGVIHRDLKPENVMLGEATGGRQSVKLLDLGIAKILGIVETLSGEPSSLTIAGQILGTPHYMSPEQWGEIARDGKAEVDARTDIYSLGVIFFELIAGRKPFAGRSIPELRLQHVASARPLLHEVVAGVPESFGRAVAHAMAKDRADRQQTAGQVIAELRATIGAPSDTSVTLDSDMATTLIKEVERPASGAGAREATARRLNAPLILSVALVMLLLSGIIGWFVWNRMRTKTAAETSTKPAAESQPRAAPEMRRVLSYWIESFDQPKKGIKKRVAEMVIPLISGQDYKFHFASPERGFLCIIGQKNGNNAFMTFLTNRGEPGRGTNLVTRNADFEFPYKMNLSLDANPGTDEFTVIFSPTPLSSPVFLTKDYRRMLTPTEVKELEDFRTQHNISAMNQSVQTENDERAVVVSVPDGMQNQPLIFVIPIEHK